MSIRRQIAWQARLGSTRLREGGRRAAVTWWGDLLTPRLVPIKVAFFLIMGATQCLAPYSTVFARALGLSLKETALVFAVSPIIPLLAPTLAGIIAGKLGNFKVFLVLGVGASGFFGLLLMTIPLARTPASGTPALPLHLICREQNLHMILLANSAPCKFINNSVTVPAMKAVQCGHLCTDPVLRYPQKLHKSLAGISVRVPGGSRQYECSPHRTQYHGPQKCFLAEFNRTRGYLDDPTSFTLDKVKLDFTDINPDDNSMDLAGRYKMTPSEQLAFSCDYGYFSRRVNITTVEFGTTQKLFRPVSQSISSSTSISNGTSVSLCTFHCNASLPFKDICKKPGSSDRNVPLTVWLFVAVNILSAFTIGLTYTLFEVAAVAVLQHYGNDYGLQRLYGTVGGIVMAPVAGLLADVLGQGKHYTDYFATFVLYCLLKLCCAAVLTFVDLHLKTPPRSLWRNVCGLLVTAEVLLLVVAVFVSGLCYGFIEHFQPWLLRDLGAANWFIGLTTTVATVSALPFLAISGVVCAKFGHVQSICFGLVIYSVRFMGYSLLTTPLWCLPLEVAEGATTGLLIASTILYAASLAPKTSQATLQGVLATVHYGAGKCVGSFTGGYLMSDFGTAVAFQIFSGASLFAAFMYYLVYKLVLLPRQLRMDEHKKEVCRMPIRNVSVKDHRRNSLRHDAHFLVAQRSAESAADEQLDVKVANLADEGDTHSQEYRYQKQRGASYPQWSDEEEEKGAGGGAQKMAGIYPLVDGSPTVSTPYSSGRPPPDCDLSDLGSGHGQLQLTEVTDMDCSDDSRRGQKETHHEVEKTKKATKA